METSATEAKKLLLYYFELLANQANYKLNNDNRYEIKSIIDFILNAAKEGKDNG